MARRKSTSAPLAPTVTSPAKMGEEMANVQAASAQSPNVKSRPRGGAKSGAPVGTISGPRSQHQERLGAKWAPQMPMYEQNAAAASETQQNVRLVSSAVGNRDFWTKRQYGQTQQ